MRAYTARCMGNETMKRDYPKPKQRLAVAHAKYRKKKGNPHNSAKY